MRTFQFKKYRPANEKKGFASFFNTMMENRFYRMVFGGVAGALLSLVYWKLIGCSENNCSLRSIPEETVMMFSFLGIFLLNIKYGNGCCS